MGIIIMKEYFYSPKYTNTDVFRNRSLTGMVVGRLQYQYERRVDYLSSNRGVRNVCFILLVGKKCVFGELADDEFYVRYLCIIITGKGQSDLATKRFLRKVLPNTKLPVLGLVDCDIYGIAILCTYLFGSESMCYNSKELVTSRIRWLGVRPSDINKYKILSEVLTWGLTDKERTYAKKRIEKLQTVSRAELAEEIEEMIKMDCVVRIEVLDALGIGFLSNHFLLNKIINRDWI